MHTPTKAMIIEMKVSFRKFSPNAKYAMIAAINGIVASGLILFSLGAKYLPAAELALLSLMEVVGGVLWVWLPAFGINEVPSLTTLIGGGVVIFAVIIHGMGAQRKRMPITS